MLPEIVFAMSGKSFSLFGLVWFGILMYNFKITKPNQNELKLLPDIGNLFSGNFYPESFLI